MNFCKAALGRWRSLRIGSGVVALLVVGVASGLSANVSPVFAQGAVIRDIQVVGNRRVEPETVRSYLQFNVGSPYDAGKVDRSLRALFATGLFSDVKIDQTQNGVLITVVENPVVNQVGFEGNSEVDAKTLGAEVQLKPRSVYTRARALADVQRILDVYRRQGRFAAQVDPQLIELEQNRVNVVFVINEGKATKVKGINFVGNRVYSAQQLRDVITTAQAGLFDFLKGNTVYDPDRLSLDRELLRQYYLKNGYADVRILSANAELDRDGSGFFITFTVDEGALYNFGSVRIESALPQVNTSALSSILLTKSGSVYNATQIEKSAEQLTLAVSEQGFPFGRARPKADRDPAGQLVNIVYTIDEGPRVYIERINIIGNLRTKDYVVRREFRLAEGDAFNPLMVEQAKKRLDSLGFFKKVEIKKRAGSASDRVVLDVVLTEQPTGELSFGAGYSTAEGVIGDVSIAERNLLGNGQYLRLKVGGSLTRAQVDLSFTEPRFLDQNISAGFDLFFKDTNNQSYASYNARKVGGSVRLGFPLAENIWLNTAYTLSYDNIYNVDTTTASRAVIDSQGSYITSSVGTSITYDTRNHPQNPNRGFFLQLAGDFAGLGGDTQYYRAQAEGRAYYPVTEKVTLVGRAVGGYVQGWGGQDPHLLDLFYKGGETIRGFDRGGIGPRDTLTGDALGGTTFWSTTAELRFPLPLVPDEIGMSGAVFADAGSLFGTTGTIDKLNAKCNQPKNADGTNPGVCLVNDDSIRTSVGASILWNSPVGPLRLDYAVPISKNTYDQTKLITFGASTKF